jgi:hypothetical protein
MVLDKENTMESKHNQHTAWAILVLLFGGAQYFTGQMYAEPLGMSVGGWFFVLGLSWLLWSLFGKS